LVSNEGGEREREFARMSKNLSVKDCVEEQHTTLRTVMMPAALLSLSFSVSVLPTVYLAVIVVIGLQYQALELVDINLAVSVGVQYLNRLSFLFGG
jgi:hypothetical protein